MTNLICAVETGDITKVRSALVKKGVDINATDKKGCTALHVARINGHIKIVDKLIAAGGKILKNNDGKTDLDLANDKARGCNENADEKENVDKIIVLIQNDKQPSNHTATASSNDDVVVDNDSAVSDDIVKNTPASQDVSLENNTKLDASSKDSVLNTAAQEEIIIDSILASANTSCDDPIASSSNDVTPLGDAPDTANSDTLA